MKTILLKLSGPMQSWGTSSHFETRQTDLYPSKSAVIGMMAAGFGYRRDDERYAALNDLDFAVRIDQPGNLLRDFHTAQKNKKNGEFDRNYVTNRYYLEDAVFIVGVGHKNGNWIDEIAINLNCPYFPLFMGRRSLPLTADYFLEIQENGVMESLRNARWQAAPWYQKKWETKREISLPVFADSNLVEDKEKILRQDRVLSFSQKERKFGFRKETRTSVTVNNPNFTQEHDAFGAIGG